MALRKTGLLTVSAVLLLAITLINVQTVRTQAPVTRLALEPGILYGEVGDSVFVNLTVHRVDYLYAWQANITYNPGVLGFVNVTEGDFLARQPEGTFGAKKIGNGFALISWTTQGTYVGESGSGTLATLEFEVLADLSESSINIRTELARGTVHPTVLVLQLSAGEIPNWKNLYPPDDFTIQSGYFINTVAPPTADFTYSPDLVGINQTVTFDASASSAVAPLEITGYMWDFDDGTNATVTTPTLNHTFTEGGTYRVSLTVIDNATASDDIKTHFNLTDTEMPSLWYELYATTKKTIGVAYTHDVAITNVVISASEVSAGEMVTITVTTKNLGTESESFDVTAYYDGNDVDSEQVTDLDSGSEETLTFDWDTTGVAVGSYRIKAVASAVEGEGNVDNNEFLDGTVTVTETAASFPILLVAGGAIVAVAVVVAIFFILRRRGSPSST